MAGPVTLPSEPRLARKTQKKQDWIRGDIEWVPYIARVPFTQITVQAYVPDLVAFAFVQVPASNVSVTAYTPVVSAGASAQVPESVLSLMAFAPVVTQGSLVEVPHVSVSVSVEAFTPSIHAGASVQLPITSIALSGYSPVLLAGAQISIPHTSTGIGSFLPQIRQDYPYRVIIPTQLPIAMDAPVLLVSAGKSVLMPVSPAIALAVSVPAVISRAQFVRTINNLNLQSNLRLCLDAGDVASAVSSSATKWLDTSGNGYDFFRGTTVSSEASDPTLNGTPGGLSNEYYSGDGADLFTYDTTNETWMDDLAKSGTTVSLAGWFYLPADSSTYMISTQKTGSPQGLLWGYSGTANTHQLLLRSSINTDIAVATSGANISTTTPRWVYMHFSGTHGAGNAFTLCIDGVITTGTYPADTYGTGTPGPMRLMISNSAGASAPNGTRMALLAAWTGVAHTSTQMQATYNATKGRFGL
jgi:hypothetical protein